MMKNFTFFVKSLGYLHSASQTHWRISKEWFLKTPERALNRAYNAAVMIKMVEEEFSGNDRVCTDLICIESDQKIALKAGFEKKMLSILKLRLAEFKFSYSVLGTLKSNSTEKFKFIGGNVGKLRFIDEVLEKCISNKQEKTTSSVRFETSELNANKPNKGPQPITIDVQVKETISE